MSECARSFLFILDDPCTQMRNTLFAKRDTMRKPCTTTRLNITSHIWTVLLSNNFFFLSRFFYYKNGDLLPAEFLCLDQV